MSNAAESLVRLEPEGPPIESDTIFQENVSAVPCRQSQQGVLSRG